MTLAQLRPYDRNPRQSRNPKFDSILASIESRGLDHPPNISRRHATDEHYLIIDGGNTRLEILNLLFDKYRRLAEQATTAAARQAHQETARSFQVLDCIFKPWRSESDTLAGHMSENEERGDTLRITAQGWTLSNSYLSRLEYAANQLLPVIPNALWAGAGGPWLCRVSILWAELQLAKDSCPYAERSCPASV